jgi:ADP-heptose:LPS heptosyltransferase
MKPFNFKKTKYLFLLRPIFKILSFFFRNKHNKGEIKEILIVDAHLIGDLIILTPLIKLLKKKYQNSKITLLAGPWSKIVFNNFNEINEFIICELPWVKYDNKIKRYHNLFFLIKKLKKTNYDICIEVRGDIRNQFILKLANIKYIISYSFFEIPYFIDEIIPFNNRINNLTLYNKNICVHLGLMNEHDNYQPFLKNDTLNLSSAFDKYIGIHFGASLPLKMPNNQISSIWIDQILQFHDDEKFVVFEIPENVKFSKYIYSLFKQKSNKNIEYWSGSLKDFILFLNNCKHLYCLDSAPSHIGAALNIKTTIIYGSTYSIMSRPASNNVSIVEGENLYCKNKCNLNKCTSLIDRECFPKIIV